jgi:predicted transcriptional regulator
MEVVYRLGQASVADVLAQLPDPPSYSAVRAMMRLLEEKGHLRHKQQGARYVYLPVQSRETARRSALKHLVRTFFDGSAENAVAALLDLSDKHLNESELDRIAGLINAARTKGV